VAGGESRTPHRLVESLRERRDRHRERRLIARVAFVVAGFTVLLAGVAMLLLPGPALVVIPIGLAMLALEFAWAERMLERAIEHAERARKTATETTPMQRVLTGLAFALGAGALCAWAVLGDIPIVPV
jgi:uncharacterized protein (TIGR02611 family)